MSIQNIQESKTLRAYGQKLGRKAIAERIKEIAIEIVAGEGEYQSTIRNAGKIRALAIACRWDSYWDEKQHIGYYDMYYEAKDATKIETV